MGADGANKEGGSFGIQVTVKQVTADINALSNQIESLNKLANPATDHIKALNSALTEIKATYNAFKGVKIDGAAIEKALPNFDDKFEKKLKNLEGIAGKFKTFAEALKGINDSAMQAGHMAESFRKLRDSLAQISEFATELNKAQSAIEFRGSGKVRIGPTNGQPTVFYAFSRMLETINAAIDDKQFAKFKSVATAMKTFSSSLDEMISITKSTKDGFGAVDTFFKELSDPSSNNKNRGVPRIKQLIDSVAEYVDVLSPKVQRKFVQKTNKDGVTELQSVINARVEGINDIVDSIKKLIPTLNELAGAKTDEAIEALGKAQTKILEFVDAFYNVGARSTKGGEQIRDKKTGQFTSKKTPVIEILSSKVQATRDVLNLIDTLSKDITSMTGKKIEQGIANIETAKTKIFEFVQKINSLLTGESVEKETVVQSSQQKQTGKFARTSSPLGSLNIKTVESSLKVNIEGVKDVLELINTLSTYLGQMAEDGITNGINTIELAKTKIAEFIERLGGLGERSTKGGITRNEKGQFTSNSPVKEILNKQIQGVHDVLGTISLLSTDLKGLSGKQIEDSIRVIDSAKTKIAEFIEKLSSLGTRPEGHNVTETTLHKDGSITEKSYFKQGLNANVVAVQDILSTIGLLSTNLAKLASGEEIRNGLTNIDTARTKINTFIESLGSLGKRKQKTVTNENGKNETVEELNDKLKGVYAVLDVIKILTGEITTLSKDTANALAALELAKPALIQFIKDMSDFAGLHDKTTYNKETGTFETSKVLSDRLQGFSALVNSIQPFTSVLSKLNVPDDFKGKIEKVGNAIRELITSFTPVKPEEGLTLAYGTDNMNVISSALNSYGNALGKISLPKTALGDTGTIKATAQNIYDLLDAFRTMDVQAGLDNMTVVSNVLAKYAGVLKSMSKIGVIDFSQIQKAFTEFVQALNTLVSSDALKKLDTGDTDRFGAIGRALKGVSSFLNSIIKGGDFSGFTSNIQNAIPAITNFINQMARLSTLSSFPDFERVAKAVGSFNGRLHDVNNTIEHTSRGMLKLKSIMRQVYTAFVGGAVIYSIVRGIKDAIKSMYDLEYAMARVNTIARVSSSTLTEMTHKVQEMSAKYGVESAKVSKALYDINSATIKGAASMKILEQSMALAVAGFTDVEKVADLIAKATNAYEYSANEAAKISDILFVTVERGINPMEELSEYFGRLFTVSANAGVGLKEVAAGLATLTARGYQTNVASTALNSAILKLSTGTKELNKLFKEYGFASSASALRTMGLAGALQVLNKATGGSTEKLHALGFNYRDIRAATTLASGAISEYNKTLAMMNDENYTANKTAEALAKVQDTVKYKFDQLKQTYTVFVQSISEYLNKNEAIKTLLTTLSEGLDNLTKSMRGANLTLGEQAKVGLVTLIPKLAIAYALLKPFGKVLSGAIMSFNALKDAVTPVKAVETELMSVSKAASVTKSSFNETVQGWSTMTSSANTASIAVQNMTKNLTMLTNAASGARLSVDAFSSSTKSGFTDIRNPGSIISRYSVTPAGSDIMKSLNTGLVGYSQLPASVKNLSVMPKASSAFLGRLGTEGYTDIAMNSAGFGGASFRYDPSYAMLASKRNFSASNVLGNIGKNYENINGSFINMTPSSKGIIGDAIQYSSRIAIPLDKELRNLNSQFSITKDALKTVQKPIVGVAQNFDKMTSSVKDMDIGLSSTSKNLTLVSNGASYANLSVNNMSTGFVEATETIQKSSNAMKVFGATMKSSLQQAGAFYLQMAAINGVMSLFGDITELKNAGFGFTDVFESLVSGGGRGFLSGLGGSVGKFIDILTFGSTNFGEQISNAIYSPGYTPKGNESTAKGHSAEENRLIGMLTTNISEFKKLATSGTTLDEAKITSEYDRIREEAQKQATILKISQESFNELIKPLNDNRDELLRVNAEYSELRPRAAALKDVFEDAGKKMEEAFEKFAGTMQKQALKLLSVEDAISTIERETGLSKDVIKGSFSTASNTAEFTAFIENSFSELEKAVTAEMRYGTRFGDEAIKRGLGSATLEDNDALASYMTSYVKNALNALYSGTALSEEQKKMFKANEEAIFENVKNNARTYLGDTNKLYTYLLDFLEPSAEFRTAVSTMTDNFKEASKEADKLVKSIVKLGTDAQKLTEHVSVEDVVKNSFGLSGVSSIKDELKNAIFTPDLINSLTSDKVASDVDAFFNDLKNTESYFGEGGRNEKMREFFENFNPEFANSKSYYDFSNALDRTVRGETNLPSYVQSFSEEEMKEKVKALIPKSSLNEISSSFYPDLVAKQLDPVLSDVIQNIINKESFEDIQDKLVEQLRLVNPELDDSELEKQATMFYDKVKEMIDFTSDFVNQLSELDYMKFMNKVQFGGELSAYKQFKKVDSAEIQKLAEREIGFGDTFQEVLTQFQKDVEEFGFDEAQKLLSMTYDEEGARAFFDAFKDYQKLDSGAPSALRTENKNIKKKVDSFIKNFEDAFLTPMQKFDKTDSVLKKQLARIRRQAKEGVIDPELASKALDNVEKLQKLNEETMTMKVPSSITASEAVKTGSKAAFDMVATNIFRDMYKVNKEQLDKNKELVNIAKEIRDVANKSNAGVSIVPATL